VAQIPKKSCAENKPNRTILLLNVPEDLQIHLMKGIYECFSSKSIEISSNPNFSERIEAIFATLTPETAKIIEKKSDVPTFLFVPDNDCPDELLTRIATSRQTLDYSFLSEPKDTLVKRLYLFLKTLQKRKELVVAEPTSVKFSEKLLSFLSWLFRARRKIETVEMSPVIGEKWERIRRLGFGSFGEVWLVRRKGTLSEDYAVAKIPHSSRSNSKFLQEAKILRRLGEHPNAVRLIEVIRQADKVVLIEEFVDGKTLQELIDEGMEPRQKELLFAQILDLVAFAHDHRIMHRDLKPENILVTSQNLVKVLDFGTAKDVSVKSISSTVIGSRPFMAPEQIMGQSRRASDVWALGVLLYALSTEYLPFYSEREKELMDLILETNPRRPSELVPEIPEELERIILKCLEKDVSKRYHHARSLQEDLKKTFPDFGNGRVIPE